MVDPGSMPSNEFIRLPVRAFTFGEKQMPKVNSELAR